MPISLAPLSRRRFLAGSLAAGAALLTRQRAQAAYEPDPNRFALLSDIHIDANKSKEDRGVNMADHLRIACEQVMQLDKPPACTIINGDCAHLTGESEDYLTLLELLHPLRKAGMSLHLAMGNHDQRDHLWRAIPADESRGHNVPGRQTLLFETPAANWIMLDSLLKTNFTPGQLGRAQLAWLSNALSTRPKKPAIVMVHHNPQEAIFPATASASGPASTQPYPQKSGTGLTDTPELLELLHRHRHVKALIFGHTHAWGVYERDGLHLINLPAVAYLFHPGQASGWVDARLTDSGMSLELRCIDSGHPWNGQTHQLKWRP